MSAIGSSGCREDSPLFRRLLYVAFFVEIGLLLIVVPWSRFWDQNYFAALWPPLRPIVDSSYVRGAVTGMGVVNLCAGLIDLAAIFSRGPGRPLVDEETEHSTP